jgi:hypothetical protein
VWTFRFSILAAAPAAPAGLQEVMLYTAIIVHGVAFTFVTISFQLEVDYCAGKSNRATAQGLVSVAMMGLGCFLGSQIAGGFEAAWLADLSSAAAAQGWSKFWMAPALMSAAVFGLTALFLPRNQRNGA